MTAGEDAGATCVGYPPSLRSFGVMQLHGKSCKIFGFKELIGKIFKAKELASGRLLPGRYAQRAWGMKKGRRSPGGVMHEHG